MGQEGQHPGIKGTTPRKQQRVKVSSWPMPGSCQLTQQALTEGPLCQAVIRVNGRGSRPPVGGGVIRSLERHQDPGILGQGRTRDWSWQVKIEVWRNVAPATSSQET